MNERLIWCFIAALAILPLGCEEKEAAPASATSSAAAGEAETSGEGASKEAEPGPETVCGAYRETVEESGSAKIFRRSAAARW